MTWACETCGKKYLTDNQLFDEQTCGTWIGVGIWGWLLGHGFVAVKWCCPAPNTTLSYIIHAQALKKSLQKCNPAWIKGYIWLYTKETKGFEKRPFKILRGSKPWDVAWFRQRIRPRIQFKQQNWEFHQQAAELYHSVSMKNSDTSTKNLGVSSNQSKDGNL